MKHFNKQIGGDNPPYFSYIFYSTERLYVTSDVKNGSPVSG